MTSTDTPALTAVNELRAYLSSVISRADNDHIPDGYANDLDPNSEFISDWSTWLADKVLAALSDGGLPPEKIVAMINRGSDHD